MRRYTLPSVLVVSSLTLGVAWLGLELAGGREATTVLSGTMPSAGWEAAPLGLAYVAAWFAAVCLAPPVAAAGLVLGLWVNLETRMSALLRNRVQIRHDAVPRPGIAAAAPVSKEGGQEVR